MFDGVGVAVFLCFCQFATTLKKVPRNPSKKVQRGLKWNRMSMFSHKTLYLCLPNHFTKYTTDSVSYQSTGVNSANEAFNCNYRITWSSQCFLRMLLTTRFSCIWRGKSFRGKFHCGSQTLKIEISLFHGSVLNTIWSFYVKFKFS